MKCKICHKGFIRGELILRMVAVHVVDPDHDHIEYGLSELFGDVHVNCLYRIPTKTVCEPPTREPPTKVVCEPPIEEHDKEDEDVSVKRTNALWFVGG
jgi:hypothetical protein